MQAANFASECESYKWYFVRQTIECVRGTSPAQHKISCFHAAMCECAWALGCCLLHVLLNAAAAAVARTDTPAAAQVWCCQVQQDIISSSATTAGPYKCCINGCGF